MRCHRTQGREPRASGRASGFGEADERRGRAGSRLARAGGKLALLVPSALPALACGLLALGCAATTLRTSWEREDFRGGPFDALLVLGVSEHAGGRAAYERGLARELAARGVRALEATEVLEDREELTPERVRAWTTQLGVDGVVATHLVGVRREVDVAPPLWHPMLWEPYGHWGFGYGGYWGWRYGLGAAYGGAPGLWAGDVVHTRETVVLETNLYDASGRLIWSALTETFDPGRTETLVEEVAERVAEELTARGLVPGPTAER